MSSNAAEQRDRVAQIRARLYAATPGRWYWFGDPSGTVRSETVTKAWVIARGLRRQDGNLIAHAPADIAWLLDEVERLETDRDRARAWAALWREKACHPWDWETRRAERAA